MSTITVYKTPTCVGCPPTLKWLDKHGITPEVVTIDRKEDMPANVQALGYMQAPVVVVSDVYDDDGPVAIDHWSGFRPDKIDAYAASR